MGLVGDGGNFEFTCVSSGIAGNAPHFSIELSAGVPSDESAHWIDAGNIHPQRTGIPSQACRMRHDRQRTGDNRLSRMNIPDEKLL